MRAGAVPGATAGRPGVHPLGPGHPPNFHPSERHESGTIMPSDFVRRVSGSAGPELLDETASNHPTPLHPTRPPNYPATNGAPPANADSGRKADSSSQAAVVPGA